jgi:hypothetical protein
MTSNSRPISITVVAWIFIAVGVIAFVWNFPGVLQLQKGAFAIELVELIGLTAGIFMLRRQNWARWLALGWAVFHLIITLVPPFHGLAVHLIIFAGIAVLLLRADASRYFRGTETL